MKSILQTIKETIQINREIRLVKRQLKALDKLKKLTKRYDLELVREGSELIIRGFNIK